MKYSARMNSFNSSIRAMNAVVKQNGFSGMGTSGVSPYDIIKHFRKIKGYEEQLTKKQMRDWAINCRIMPAAKTIQRFVPAHRIKVNNKGVLEGYAEDMRNNPTKAEAVFKMWLDKWIKSDFYDVPEVSTYTWQKVFNEKGAKRIADFYFPKAKLIVEIDGGYHDNPEQKIADEKREKELKKKFGVRFIRFTNKDVIDWPEDCVSDAILEIPYKIHPDENITYG
jgi:very-short-patch-repair endonuclease